MGENSVCNLGGEDEQATQACGNVDSEVVKDQLEEFFEQFMKAKDKEGETNEIDNKVEDEDLNDSEFDEEERNTTKYDWVCKVLQRQR